MKINKEVDIQGTIRYYNEQGQLHKEDGPAVEYADGTKAWYLNGKLHREDGPAVEYASGTKAWFLNDKRYSEQDYNNYILKKRLQRILEL